MPNPSEKRFGSLGERPANIQSIQNPAKELPNRLRATMENVPDRVLYGGRVVVDLKSLYGEVTKLDELPIYLEGVKELVGEGNEVVLTGQATHWALPCRCPRPAQQSQKIALRFINNR